MTTSSPPLALSAASVGAMSVMIDRLERAWYPNEVQDISESWDYQAWPVDEFMAGLELCASITSGRDFLDVGSGIGTKLALAASCGWRVKGVEFRPQYAAMTSYICPEARVYGSDARTFGWYGDYDVIYAYLPLRRMGELLDVIDQQARHEAVLFLPECDGLEERGWGRHSGLPVWVRIGAHGF